MDIEQFNDILVNVPGSFKAKLERIRRYLHLGKASVMVGAGFSRNADVPAHIKVKQWNDVGEDIYCRLQTVKQADPKDLIFKTPMRLASQFAAVNGRSELDNLIRDSIPDDRMHPGALHCQLLSLPWRDVFTTNYDTLLERARKGLQRNYSLVTSKEMLLYKKSPRIIKLHGSFPDKTPFLMTEEDFMTYTVEHPEFVNTVRQALVESIFCLVGFSGDDPNFTSWQAWLQDVMGEYAGPSYLITCDYDYDDSFKTLMKQRGVEVINFSEVKGIEDDYKKALDFFFTFLSEREPSWRGRIEYNVQKVDYEKLLSQMQEVRENYPGWFVLPKKYYEDFSDIEYQFPYLERSFKALDDVALKENILYELDWRADKSLSFKNFEWYRQALEELIARYTETPLSDKAITIGISLLRLYRGHFDKTETAAALKERLLKELPRMSQEQYNRYYYTIAGNALSLLDYDIVDEVLKEWMPSPSHYEGIIYKALIIVESGERSAAVELLNEAYERITLSLSQTTTQEELSLRVAIEYLLAFYSAERLPEGDSRFSFLELADYMLRQINNPRKDGYEVLHGFAVGSASRSWNNNHGTNKCLFLPYRYLLLCEAYGFPIGMATSTVDEKLLANVLPQMTSFGLGYSLGAVLRSGSRKVVTAYLDRKALNTLSRQQADSMAKQLLASTTCKSCVKARKYHAENVLQPFLARLASSCSAEVVVDIFKFVHATYRTAYLGKREDMQIVYTDLLPENIQAAYDDVFDSEIYKNERDNDVPLPHAGIMLYRPSDKAIEIACKGLKSDESHERQSAYYRAERLLKSHLTDGQRNLLCQAIRHWRTSVAADLLTRDSYNDVEPDDTERRQLKAQIAKDVEKFMIGDYTFKNSSMEVSALDHDFRNITAQTLFLTKQQISDSMQKMAEVLDANYATYSQDDSEELMGGIRHFVKPIFQLVGEFVRVLTKDGYTEKQPCVALLKVLRRYLPSNLPVRITMERLNNVCRELGPNKIREEVVSDIITESEPVVVDCCNALISYVYHYSNFQTVLQDIIFYCTHAVAEHLHLYLQTLSMIPIEKMTPKTQNQLAAMLRTLMERIPKQDIAEEQKVDILHDGVLLAASLKSVTKPAALVEAVNLWREYAESEEIYNDIRRPWFVNRDV